MGRLDSDNDLSDMSPEELRQEVKKLRAGIRQHRDASGHSLCWYVPELWNLLPEKIERNLKFHRPTSSYIVARFIVDLWKRQVNS